MIRDRLDRLNAWQRSGVVLSVAWFGWAIVFSTMASFYHDDRAAANARLNCNIERGGVFAECQAIYDSIVEQADVGQRFEAFVFMTLLIPAAWVAVWLVVRSVRWIRAGIRPTGAA